MYPIGLVNIRGSHKASEEARRAGNEIGRAIEQEHAEGAEGTEGSGMGWRHGDSVAGIFGRCIAGAQFAESVKKPGKVWVSGLA